MFSNPWLNLPEHPPFVLAQDKPYVDAFNQVDNRKGDHYINLNHTPEPRLGSIDAPVIILQLNPSYSPHRSKWAGEFGTAKERPSDHQE